MTDTLEKLRSVRRQVDNLPHTFDCNAKDGCFCAKMHVLNMLNTLIAQFSEGDAVATEAKVGASPTSPANITGEVNTGKPIVSAPSKDDNLASLTTTTSIQSDCNLNVSDTKEPTCKERLQDADDTDDDDLKELLRVAIHNRAGLDDFIAMNYPKQWKDKVAAIKKCWEDYSRITTDNVQGRL